MTVCWRKAKRRAALRRAATSVTSAPAKAAKQVCPAPLVHAPSVACAWHGHVLGEERRGRVESPGKVVLSLPAHRDAELASLATHNRLVGEGVVWAGTRRGASRGCAAACARE